MKTLNIFLSFVFLLSSPIALANDNDDVEMPSLLSVITNLPDDLIDWTKETFTTENIPSLLALTGMTGAMVMTDYDTWQAVARPYNNNQTFRAFCDDGASFSAGSFQVGAAAGFLALGLTGNHRALRTAYQIGEGILASGIIVQLLKHTTGRQSPFKATSRTGRWRVPPSIKDYSHNTQEYDAMPSGHMQSVSTALFIIMDNYPDQKWMPYLVYPSLVWTSFGLVGTGIHWWSDIPIAIALSYSMSKIITRRNQPKTKKTAIDWPQLFPTTNAQGVPTMSALWQF